MLGVAYDAWHEGGRHAQAAPRPPSKGSRRGAPGSHPRRQPPRPRRLDPAGPDDRAQLGGGRTTQIAAELGCHPQTVRERLARFAAEGVDGLADRPGGGRPPRLTEHERSQIIALARSTPPGRLHRKADGTLAAAQAREPAHWTLDALTAAAHRLGIQVERSQVRRILLRERVRWRPPRSWASSTDPDFAPKEPGSSRSIPTHPRARRSSAPTSSAR
jgi:transposase